MLIIFMVGLVISTVETGSATRMTADKFTRWELACHTLFTKFLTPITGNSCARVRPLELLMFVAALA